MRADAHIGIAFICFQNKNRVANAQMQRLNFLIDPYSILLRAKLLVCLIQEKDLPATVLPKRMACSI